MLGGGDVAQKGHPVRELPAVLDRHELQVELELAAVLRARAVASASNGRCSKTCCSSASRIG